jgi:hypothetical protein
VLMHKIKKTILKDNYNGHPFGGGLFNSQSPYNKSGVK